MESLKSEMQMMRQIIENLDKVPLERVAFYIFRKNMTLPLEKGKVERILLNNFKTPECKMLLRIALIGQKINPNETKKLLLHMQDLLFFYSFIKKRIRRIKSIIKMRIILFSIVSIALITLFGSSFIVISQFVTVQKYSIFHFLYLTIVSNLIFVLTMTFIITRKLLRKLKGG